MRLAADANALLSALIGGHAARIFHHPAIREILTTEYTMAEVQEYAPILARKRGLALDLVLMAAASLPVTIVGRAAYAPSLPEARKRSGRRGPDDAELRAPALQ